MCLYDSNCWELVCGFDGWIGCVAEVGMSFLEVVVFLFKCDLLNYTEIRVLCIECGSEFFEIRGKHEGWICFHR